MKKLLILNVEKGNKISLNHKPKGIQIVTLFAYTKQKHTNYPNRLVIYMTSHLIIHSDRTLDTSKWLKFSILIWNRPLEPNSRSSLGFTNETFFASLSTHMSKMRSSDTDILGLGSCSSLAPECSPSSAILLFEISFLNQNLVRLHHFHVLKRSFCYSPDPQFFLSCRNSK